MGFLAETFVTGVVARLNRPGWSVPEGFLRDSGATQKGRTAAVMKCAGRGCYMPDDPSPAASVRSLIKGRFPDCCRCIFWYYGFTQTSPVFDPFGGLRKNLSAGGCNR